MMRLGVVRAAGARRAVLAVAARLAVAGALRFAAAGARDFRAGRLLVDFFAEVRRLAAVVFRFRVVFFVAPRFFPAMTPSMSTVNAAVWSTPDPRPARTMHRLSGPVNVLFVFAHAMPKADTGAGRKGHLG
jgi:hypothetical protein